METMIKEEAKSHKPLFREGIVNNKQTKFTTGKIHQYFSKNRFINIDS